MALRWAVKAEMPGKVMALGARVAEAHLKFLGCQINNFRMEVGSGTKAEAETGVVRLHANPVRIRALVATRRASCLLSGGAQPGPVVAAPRTPNCSMRVRPNKRIEPPRAGYAQDVAFRMRLWT